jgi:predicted ribosome quality control (RQC) complex YloA/Tae2 family protein
MPLDAVFLSALRNELDAALRGMRIDKIQQPEQDQLLLTLRGQGASERLLLSAGAGDARVHLTDAAFENPANPPMFCMLLRKHLTGARIGAVAQPPLERSIEIDLDCVDALGEPCRKRLIVELMGRYSNIVLTDREGLIIDCLRRVDSLMSARRQVLPGLYYRRPPAQQKRNPLDMAPEALAGAISSAPGDVSADKWLLDTFAGFSPLICRELVYRAYGETDLRLRELRDGGRALGRAFSALTGDILSGRLEPVMLLDDLGKPFDFSYTEILQYGSALVREKAASFSALLDAFYTRRFMLERLRQRSQGADKVDQERLRPHTAQAGRPARRAGEDGGQGTAQGAGRYPHGAASPASKGHDGFQDRGSVRRERAGDRHPPRSAENAAAERRKILQGLCEGKKRRGCIDRADQNRGEGAGVLKERFGGNRARRERKRP